MKLIDSKTELATPLTTDSESSLQADRTVTKPDRTSPTLLVGREFYNDKTREVTLQTEIFRSSGNTASENLLKKISDRPGTTWLTGPTESDPLAQRDIDAVARTSKEAFEQGKVVTYQLYAIPRRDACAEYSKGGFLNATQYADWINRIVGALKGEAIFFIEADAIAQTVMNNCLSRAEVAERYAMLASAVTTLQASDYVLATYLDAGHPEWINDPAKLVEPLKASGIAEARGITVNVSNFVETPTIVAWSADLIELLGGGKKIVVDTSRNGQGSPPSSVTGDGRWCNPAGRGIGEAPTTTGLNPLIDAYVYIKNIGESDGNCFGNPAAGVFSLDLALELAKNAR
jgi:endoglucanase